MFNVPVFFIQTIKRAKGRVKAVGTIVVGLILAVIVGAAVYSMVRGRIKGKHSCDGSCGHCRGCH